ncbi:hypothetical protein Cseg_4153 [Caulobacter segnis ATCC 21756]|uniref:Uncharacterized protein n=1 Tax=Caulobacter segnis (strain ATCC 21756 / DSM 7131 / JCM 7823 / NBRC 15250 / LMG 17158 / TK0059) TaxID=509190 RepID=D5VPZ0_CAUST|nr:hypothetical protein Cseg_4153 [Caulobacter segnis ATCC 21756]
MGRKPTSRGRSEPYISWRLQRAGLTGLVKDGFAAAARPPGGRSLSNPVSPAIVSP